MDSIYRVVLDLKADGTSAVRAVRTVAKESQKSSETVAKGNKKQEDSFHRVGESAHRLRGAIGSLAGTIGLAGLGFGIADVIKAGQDWQTQQARLQQSLRNTGRYSLATMRMLNRSAETTATHGGFAAPQQIQALSQFVRLTGSASRAIKMNRAAMEMARGAGLDYSATQSILGRALTGNVGRLQKYLGIIQPVKTAEFALSQAHKVNIFQLEMQSKAMGKLGPLWLKQQMIQRSITPGMLQHAQLLDRQATAQKVLGIIQAKYGGSMRSFSRTTAGAISNAKNAINLAIEKLGATALPLVAKIATAIASFVTYLSNHKDVLIAFGTALGAIGAAFSFTMVVDGLKALAGAVLTFSGAEEGATVATIAWGTAMRLTIIGIAITALYMLITHFSTVKRIALDVWHWILTAARNTWMWIKGHWTLLAGILLFPIVGPAGIIFALFHKQILGAAQAVWKWIKGAWHTLYGILTWPFREAWKVIRKILGGIMGPIKSIGHFFGSAGRGIGHFLGSLNPFHSGGLVRHMAYGGPIGGYGGGDSVPAMLEPGEWVLRKEAVQNIGVQNLNSINAGGSVSSGPHSGPDQVYVSAPIKIMANGRILAEQTVHFAAKKAALSGGYVSG